MVVRHRRMQSRSLHGPSLGEAGREREGEERERGQGRISLKAECEREKQQTAFLQEKICIAGGRNVGFSVAGEATETGR